MRNKADMIKKMYPAGTRICCDDMPDDPQPIPKGTCGTVVAVDDAGQLLMKWDNGRSLSLIPGVDSFHIVDQSENIVNIESEGLDISM